MLGAPEAGAIALSMARLVRNGTDNFVTVPKIIINKMRGSSCLA